MPQSSHGKHVLAARTAVRSRTTPQASGEQHLIRPLAVRLVDKQSNQTDGGARPWQHNVHFPDVSVHAVAGDLTRFMETRFNHEHRFRIRYQHQRRRPPLPLCISSRRPSRPQLPKSSAIERLSIQNECEAYFNLSSELLCVRRCQAKLF